ncbi:MAG: TolC family protein [Spirochaetaceae bacterium]
MFLVLSMFLTMLNGFFLMAQEVEQSSISFELKDAWLKMEEYDPDLRKLLIDQAAAYRDMNSKGYLIPSISLTSNLSRSSPLISSLTNSEDQDLSEEDNWSLRAGVDLRLNLKTNMKTEDKVNALQYNLLILRQEIIIRDLRAGLEKLYYQISAGEKKIELQERISGLIQSRFEQIEILYNKGLRSESDLLTSQISVARDLPLLQKARVEQEKRLIQFRELLGLEPHMSVSLVYLPDRTTDTDLETKELKLRLVKNEEYRMALLQLELAKKNRELLKKNQKSPSLGLSLGWSTSMNPLFNSDSWTSEDWSDSMTLSFSFSLPLDSGIKGSEDQNNLLKLDEIIQKMEITLEYSEQTMVDNIQSLLLDLDLSRSNVEVNELNIKLQEINFKKVQGNYENGRTSLLDLDNSRQELQKALVALENEKLNKNLILIELEKIIGLSLQF